ncbi:M-phase inducer phosphatase [Musca vetustissima]|uniref:M-phase inducer phosphatase n=1 Tax=Musca vetustissima TaxID=27455 RepID=UPI002AB6AB8B|nr:M-phase inducer phosphatase [Musca vetustissima]
MAFTRHQIEKRRLIELVKVNPILWDCRLPHYKRSDKKKALKWNELGRIFNVNGERVQRTFTSLREIFRRELNHEKMLGSRFKSKWEYYDEMAFLKEVIRERKSRERAKSNDGLTPSNNNNNSTTGIDEYQYFAPNDPNNPQNQAIPLLATIPTTCALVLPQSAANTLATQNGSLTPHMPNNPPNTPVSTISGSQVPTDVILNLNPNTLAALQKLNANGNSTNLQPPPRPISRARSLTTRSCSSSPSIYIKDEPDSLDDTISLATTSNGKIKDYHSSRSLHKTKNSSSKLVASGKNLNNSTQNLVIDERDCSDIDDDPDVDMLDDDRLSISTSLVSLPKETATGGSGKNSQKTNQLLLKPTAHEILYTKFGEFLAARLNTLDETVANELMNKILMLIAEK